MSRRQQAAEAAGAGGSAAPYHSKAMQQKHSPHRLVTALSVPHSSAHGRVLNAASEIIGYYIGGLIINGAGPHSMDLTRHNGPDHLGS